MESELTKRAYEISKGFRRVSPALFMRKLKLSWDGAFKVCCKVWLKQHLEARELAKKIGD